MTNKPLLRKVFLSLSTIFSLSLGTMTATSLTDSGTNGLEEKEEEAVQCAQGLQHPGYFPVAQNFGITPVSKLHKA